MSLTLLFLMNLGNAPAASGSTSAAAVTSTGKIWNVWIVDNNTWIV